MTTLIGIHGKPRAGKDTIASVLINEYGFLRYGPSVPVKATTAAMFNIPVEYLNDDNMKDKFNSFWGLTYRQMAQKVGKECSRDIFGEDFWMRHVEYMLNHALPKYNNGVVLADIRYENEVHWVRKQGGRVWFVERKDRPTVSNEQHAAEQGLSDNLADMILLNNGTIEELQQSVREIMHMHYQLLPIKLASFD
jgi:hypothetical protein